MNTVTENYWIIYAAATVIMTLSCGVLWHSLSNLKLACHVDRDNTVPLIAVNHPEKLLPLKCFHLREKLLVLTIFKKTLDDNVLKNNIFKTENNNAFFH